MTHPLDFTGRSVIITGAGSGLGKSYALAFASRGARVVVNDINASGTGDTVAEIAQRGGTAIASVHDITTGEGAAAIVADATAAFGSVDILVNNAGLLRDADFAAISDADWTRVLSVNVNGSFLMTRAAWPSLQASAAARVVFITSASGLFGNVGHAHYSTSKAAVLGLMKAVALEGEEDGILSNAIAPLAVSPQSLLSTSGASRRMSSRDIIGDAFSSFVPDHVSAAVLALGHESFTQSGQTLTVGGGLVRVVRTAVSGGILSDSADPAELIARWNEITQDDYSVPISLHADALEIRRRVTDQE